MAKARKWTADEILGMLKSKHNEDVLIPECKVGPAGSRRMDAWVMKSTWSPVTIIGYEIKVSRADFLGDNKWRSYMDFCNVFYFVAPKGVIKKEELPPDVGLIEACEKRLLTRKKAPVRELPPLVYMPMVHALMWRTDKGRAQDKLSYWRRFLAEKKEGQRIGRMVSERVTRICDRIESENRSLKSENETLLDIKEYLKEEGLVAKDESCISLWSIRRRIKEMTPSGMSVAIERMRKNLDEFKEVIDGMGDGDG